MPYTKHGRGWLPDDKPYAVNVIYQTGLAYDEQVVDHWALRYKQSHAEAILFHLQHLTHDILVNRLVGTTYALIDRPYEALANGVLAEAAIAWDQTEPFLEHLLDHIRKFGVYRSVKEKRHQISLVKNRDEVERNLHPQEEPPTPWELDKARVGKALLTLEGLDLYLVSAWAGVGTRKHTHKELGRHIGWNRRRMSKYMKKLMARLGVAMKVDTEKHERYRRGLLCTL